MFPSESSKSADGNDNEKDEEDNSDDDSQPKKKSKYANSFLFSPNRITLNHIWKFNLYYSM